MERGWQTNWSFCPKLDEQSWTQCLWSLKWVHRESIKNKGGNLTSASNGLLLQTSYCPPFSSSSPFHRLPIHLQCRHWGVQDLNNWKKFLPNHFTGLPPAMHRHATSRVSDKWWNVAPEHLLRVNIWTCCLANCNAKDSLDFVPLFQLARAPFSLPWNNLSPSHMVDLVVVRGTKEGQVIYWLSVFVRVLGRYERLRMN